MAVDLGLGDVSQGIGRAVRAANTVDYGPVQDPVENLRDYGLGDWDDIVTPELIFVWGISRWGDSQRRVGR